MAFKDKQVRQLRSKLRSRHIRERDADGISLRYLEGWHIIAEANRIFGFDGWSRETVESKCVYTKQTGNRYEAAYVTRVRITVSAGGERITREGSGAGEANTATPGKAHENAAKAAETDATKRALMTFGNPFGLSLYGNGHLQAHHTQVVAGKPSPNGQTSGASVSTRTSPNGAQQAGIKPADLEPATTIASETALSPSDEQQRKHTREVLRRTFTPTGASAHRRRIDKSALTIREPVRHRNPQHLKRVASRRCLVCGKNRTQAHHLKFAQPSAMARKVSDEFTVPLCSAHHQELHHSGNERDWWKAKSIDPIAVARELWEASNSSQQTVLSTRK